MENQIVPQPNQPLHKHLHPGIWVTGLIIIAGIVGYVLWVNAHRTFCCLPLEQIKQNNLNQTGDVDETANWQTYRNEEYGFEVKYPPDWKDWTYSRKQENGVVLAVHLEGGDDVGDPIPPEFIIKVFEKNKYKYEPLTTYYDNKPARPKISNIKIAESNATRYTYELPSIEGSIDLHHQVELTKDDEVYLLEYWYSLCGATPACTESNEHQKKENDEIFDQILSTFRFDKKN